MKRLLGIILLGIFAITNVIAHEGAVDSAQVNSHCSTSSYGPGCHGLFAL